MLEEAFRTPRLHAGDLTHATQSFPIHVSPSPSVVTIDFEAAANKAELGDAAFRERCHRILAGAARRDIREVRARRRGPLAEACGSIWASCQGPDLSAAQSPERRLA